MLLLVVLLTPAALHAHKLFASQLPALFASQLPSPFMLTQHLVSARIDGLEHQPHRLLTCRHIPILPQQLYHLRQRGRQEFSFRLNSVMTNSGEARERKNSGEAGERCSTHMAQQERGRRHVVSVM